MKRPELAVGAVVVHDRRLLMIQRLHPPGAGRWSLPGGRVEGGETLSTAVAREVREETGLDVDVGTLCGLAERIGDDHHFVILDFWAVATAASAVADDDASAVAWMDAHDLATQPLVDGLQQWLADHGVLEALG